MGKDMITLAEIQAKMAAKTQLEQQETKERRLRQPVPLRVGNKRFLVQQRETLTQKSPFFRALLADLAKVDTEDGYTVDCDPAAFSYILDHLQSGRYPLCLDDVQNLDFAMYDKVSAVARLLGIDDLIDWLNSKTYFDGVEVTYEQYFWPSGVGTRKTTAVSVECRDYERKERVYICPSNLQNHVGPQDCAQDVFVGCITSLGKDGWEGQYRDRVVSGTLVREKKVKINKEVFNPQLVVVADLSRANPSR